MYIGAKECGVGANASVRVWGYVSGRDGGIPAAFSASRLAPIALEPSITTTTLD